MYDSEINDLIKELEIKNYLGTVMKDQIKDLKKPIQEPDDSRSKAPESNYYFIYNLQTSEENGSHWRAAGQSQARSFDFDPYGDDPILEIIDFLPRPIISSTFKIQGFTERCCGLYCILLIYLLEQGKDFENAVLELVK